VQTGGRSHAAGAPEARINSRSYLPDSKETFFRVSCNLVRGNKIVPATNSNSFINSTLSL
jgi:hypothetical protein